jgi:hypothetical protein
MTKEYDDVFKLLLKNKQYPSYPEYCYNFETKDCDGRCQGCSDCLLAKYFRGERKNKPTNLTMLKDYYLGKQFVCCLKYATKDIDWNEVLMKT